MIASEISGFDAGNDLKADAPLKLGRGRHRVYWPMEILTRCRTGVKLGNQQKGGL